MEFFTSMNQRFLTTVSCFLTRTGREDGQTFVEYALILGIIAVGTAAALTILQGQISALYGHIIADFPFN
jgi:Flp pilus assembly pilin Flp